MISSIREKINTVNHLYDLGKISGLEELKGGLINRTYLVCEDTGYKYIFQEVHPMFKPTLINDVVTIANHLRSVGWDCPVLIESNDGKVCIIKNSKMWRVYKYIEGVDFNEEFLKKEIYCSIGELLGVLHHDLAALNYRPIHKITGFHESIFYIEKAKNVKIGIQQNSLEDIANKIISLLGIHGTHVSDCKQLIHGDPRIENILFEKGGTPYTFIDFDTFMWGSVYIDIGDCLRSLLLLEDKTSFAERVRLFVSGYKMGNPSNGLIVEGAVESLKYVTLELTLRFIIDSVEQNYFAWDATKYKSSSEHNTVRATQSWEFFKKINQEL